ncbi:hypothetical protein SBA5_1360001 [Candidatus Sulfotelmatomonas gaucii]|uniref:Uncharacterized protein n=1 Tax=Candidatus Sulfuritelmatomonas gaucii TaxID=2043161 RepID=A0A2N9L4E7_9BACT|nr:hypothetical protein SBA5_1360001 [Candidatus Sulfotelmatomonas gaucii]
MLCNRYEPESFSEHLAWSSHAGVYFNDLLPLPYTRHTLARVAQHIDAGEPCCSKIHPTTLALPKARSLRSIS